ncbi:MAG: septum formation protein Maf [Coriobacteriaceae bacterium]|nr:septum formation protein Maf [Coriobacteriaceae bacterium]
MILASQSPRRIELLRETGRSFAVQPADIDEAARPGEDPFALVGRLAEEKARHVAAAAAAGELVLAADTVVALDGRILGKPAGDEEARSMLHALSGRVHAVATGVALARAGAAPELLERFVDTCEVRFHELTDEEVDDYVASGEPADKAGAYGIQGAGGRLLVHSIHGDFYTVVGLPIARVHRMLRALGA